MDTCEAFLNAYRNLEEVLAVKYGQRSGTIQTFASREGAKYFEELNLFREMRNLLSHHGRIEGEHAVLPSEASLKKLLEILNYAKNPPIALSIATPKEHLMCAAFKDNIDEILDKMEKRGYSHIPILNPQGSLFGVFSVGTLFTFARKNPKSTVYGTSLSTLADFLPPEKHTTEKFAFVTPEATLYDLKQLFSLAGPYHRRVVAVFVTKDGTKDSPLLGMITPWDVFKSENN